LNTECDADESSRAWLGALTRKAGYLHLDRAVFEDRLLDDRKNLFSSLHALALNVDEAHGTAPTIAGNFGLHLHGLCPWLVYALQFQTVHGIQGQRRGLCAGLVTIFQVLGVGYWHAPGNQKTGQHSCSNQPLLQSVHVSAPKVISNDEH